MMRTKRIKRKDKYFHYRTLLRTMWAAVGRVLAREAKEVVIGEAADPALIVKIRQIVEAHPEISSVNHVRTIHTAPDSIFVAVSADFKDALRMGQAEELIETIEGELKAASPLFSSIYIRPEKREDAVVQTGGDLPAR